MELDCYSKTSVNMQTGDRDDASSGSGSDSNCNNT